MISPFRLSQNRFNANEISPLMLVYVVGLFRLVAALARSRLQLPIHHFRGQLLPTSRLHPSRLPLLAAVAALAFLMGRREGIRSASPATRRAPGASPGFRASAW
jgi:hypothetical protein